MFDRIRRALAPANETRAVSELSLAALIGPQAGAPAPITAARAEELAALQACVNVIAGSIATLPAFVRRREPGGALVEAPEHPVSRLISAGPNPWQTWPEWLETWIGSALLHGNGLSRIDVDDAGQPVALVPYAWGAVTPLLLGSGRLAFDVTDPALAGGTGQKRRLLQDEVLLLKDRSDDGLLGRSRISRSSTVLRQALDLQDRSGYALNNLAAPSGIFELPAAIKPEGMKRISEHFSQGHTGAPNASKVLFVDRDTKYTPTTPISPVDAQVLESRAFSVIEVCRLFGVPSPLANDLSHSSFTNSETAGRWLAIHTLRPWIAKIEAAFQAVFAPHDRGVYVLSIDLSGLLRGADEARWQSYQIAVQNGILTPNEVREAEGYNPLPDQPAADPVVG